LLVRLAAVAAAVVAVVVVVAAAAAAAAAEGAGRRADRTCLLLLLSCKASRQQLEAPQCGRCAVWPVVAAAVAVSAGLPGVGVEEETAGEQSGHRCPGAGGTPGRAGRASR